MLRERGSPSVNLVFEKRVCSSSATLTISKWGPFTTDYLDCFETFRNPYPPSTLPINSENILYNDTLILGFCLYRVQFVLTFL